MQNDVDMPNAARERTISYAGGSALINKRASMECAPLVCISGDENYLVIEGCVFMEQERTLLIAHEQISDCVVRDNVFTDLS